MGAKTQKKVDKKKPLQNRNLTSIQEKGIVSILAGNSYAKTAIECNVSHQAVSKWMKSPYFLARLEKARREVWKEIQGMARPLLHKSIETLNDFLMEKDTYQVPVIDSKGAPVKDKEGNYVMEERVNNVARNRKVRISLNILATAFESGVVNFNNENNVDKWPIIRSALMDAVKQEPRLRDVVINTVIKVERQLDPDMVEVEEEQTIDGRSNEV